MKLRMLPAILLMLTGLTACAMRPQSEPPAQSTNSVEVPTVTLEEMDGEGICNAQRVQSIIGQRLSAGIMRQAAYASGAKVVRGLRPSDVVTQEYSSQRLNLHVDENMIITRANCG